MSTTYNDVINVNLYYFPIAYVVYYLIGWLRNPRIAPVQYYVKTLVAFTIINKLTKLECSKESGFFSRSRLWRNSLVRYQKQLHFTRPSRKLQNPLICKNFRLWHWILITNCKLITRIRKKNIPLKTSAGISLLNVFGASGSSTAFGSSFFSSAPNTATAKSANTTNFFIFFLFESKIQLKMTQVARSVSLRSLSFLVHQLNPRFWPAAFYSFCTWMEERWLLSKRERVREGTKEPDAGGFAFLLLKD